MSIVFKIANIIYKILSSIIPVNNRRIIIECDYGKGLYGNMKYIYSEIVKEKLNYQIIIPVNKGVKININDDNTKIVRTRGIKHFYYLITARFWITNNHYYYFLEKRKETKYINTWHALGAFKKFGMDCNCDDKEMYIRDGKNIDSLLVSSKQVASIYSKALNVDIDKIISIGIPRTDILFDDIVKEGIRKKFCKEFGDKKVILYAPTFRDREKEKFELKLDIEKLINNVGEKYILFIKLHPIIRAKVDIPQEFKKSIFDVSEYDMNELLIYSDILITDYSSVVFEFALLEKPIIFFAYDLEEFKENSRQFYFGYEEFIPDSPVRDTNEIINKIKKYDNDENEITLTKIKEFGEKYCEFKDGKSTQRFIRKFLYEKE